MSKIELTEQEINWILDDVFTGELIDVTIRKLQNISTRREFNRYLKENPEFAQEYYQAVVDSCTFLENDLLSLHKKCKGDFKLARVLLDSIVKVLQFRNPEKYGNKLDLNVQTVSIIANLNASDERIKALLGEREVKEIEGKVKGK